MFKLLFFLSILCSFSDIPQDYIDNSGPAQPSGPVTAPEPSQKGEYVSFTAGPHCGLYLGPSLCLVHYPRG